MKIIKIKDLEIQLNLIFCIHRDEQGFNRIIEEVHVLSEIIVIVIYVLSENQTI